MFRIFKREPTKPELPWLYLGWSECTYNNGDGAVAGHLTIHFYGRGDELEERRFEYVGQGKYDIWKYHWYIQQVIIPWSHGENLWTAIGHPSENFKGWTKEHCGWEWNGARWYKPAKKIEDNIVEFPAQRITEDR